MRKTWLIDGLNEKEELGMDVEHDFLKSVDKRSYVPVYKQIKNQIEFAITSGRLKAGDQLPPILPLSELLGLNHNTVYAAYRNLELRGLVYTKRGSGVFVNEGAAEQCREECLDRIISRLHEVTQEGKAAGMSHVAISVIMAESCAVLYAETPDWNSCSDFSTRKKET